MEKPDDDKEKRLIEKAIQCNVQKLIEKYNKTATNENVENNLNQSCSDPIQYYESQFCIEVITDSDCQIKPNSKAFIKRRLVDLHFPVINFHLYSL